MKRSRLNRKSKPSKRRRQLEAEQDVLPRVPFEEVRQHLPPRVADWPAIVRVLNRPNIVRAYIAELRGRPCPLCKERPVSEVHHLCAGSRGRADERANLLGLCAACHREVQSVVAEYKRVWRAKREQDPDGCNWVRLVLLLGRWPDFENLD
jgi:5-methylcytosine-specific restriction endonuclease McrA